MHFSTYITLVHQVVAVVTAVNSLRLFSRRASDYRKIRTFVGVPISRCERECDLRSRCQGVIYVRKIPGCVLISDSQLGQNTADDTGTVLTTGFGAFGSADCGSGTCSSSETCVEDGNGYVCKTTGCASLPSFYTSVKGNMYTVANRVVLARGSVILRVTCGSDGLWEPDNTYANAGNDCTSILGVSGLYTLPTAMIDVYCDMDTDEGHWTVFQRRQDGSVDFLRGWDDYASGFGNLEGEFWIGLEPLYKILRTGRFELRVDMEAFSGERRYAKYKTFSLTGEADNYRLSVDGYSGDAGDSMKKQDGMMFSTIDSDNDEFPTSCAEKFKGAWWYRKCHDSNLNGLYPHGGENTGGYADHITWVTWLGYYSSPKRTEMKLRRN